MFIPLLVLIVLFASATVLVVFGDSPSLRNTKLSRIRLRILALLRNATVHYNLFNDHHFAGKLTVYLGYLVPTGYLAIVTVCLQQFFVKTMPMLQDPNYLYIFLSIALIYISTALATFSDPGIVGHGDFPTFEPNNLIFFPNSACKTCGDLKPARSKHCSVCDHCFVLYDHHCVWVNNCIGYRNYRWFVLYLLANINFLGYGSYLCGGVMRYQLQHDYTDYGYWTVITSTTEANRVTGIFVILTSIFVIIAVLFTGLQVWYLYLGVTTNEVDKWGSVEYLVKIGVLYRCNGPEPYVEKVVSKEGEVVYISLKDERILQCDQNSLEQITSVENDLVNIYDEGFWNNAKRRLMI